MYGYDIPLYVYRLTRGNNGVLKDWLDNDRKHLLAVVAEIDGDIIGWAALVRANNYWLNKAFYISVFVSKDHRSKSIGGQLLDQILLPTGFMHPKAKILYGAPSDHEKFNNAYKLYIEKHGLTPIRHFAVD